MSFPADSISEFCDVVRRLGHFASVRSWDLDIDSCADSAIATSGTVGRENPCANSFDPSISPNRPVASDQDRKLLSVDRDIEVGETDRSHEPPVHLRWQYLALVALGGTVGTALRQLLSFSVPSLAGVPVMTMGINLLGAFLLGVLLEELMHRGPDQGRRRHLRLLLGTGVLGGFTTYSALAADAFLLLSHGRPVPALLYAFGTLFGGALASWAGITLSTVIRRRRSVAPREATR